MDDWKYVFLEALGLLVQPNDLAALPGRLDNSVAPEVSHAQVIHLSELTFGFNRLQAPASVDPLNI